MLNGIVIVDIASLNESKLENIFFNVSMIL